MMIVIIMAFAVNGGLFAGAIAYSVYKTNEMRKASGFFQRLAIA